MTFIANALGMGPAQQAQAQQSQQNYAQGVSQQGSQLAQAQALYAWVQMMQQAQQYLNQNPNPANTWGGIQAPTQIGGTIGGGQIGQNGSQSTPNAQNLTAHYPAAPTVPGQTLPSMTPIQGGSVLQPGFSGQINGQVRVLPPQSQPQPQSSGIPQQYLQMLMRQPGIGG